MKLEFIKCKVKSDSQLFKTFPDFFRGKETIIVGEEKIENEKFYRVHPLTKNNLHLIKGFNLLDSAFYVRKKEIKRNRHFQERVVVEVDKEFLTLDVVEEIQRLNK